MTSELEISSQIYAPETSHLYMRVSFIVGQFFPFLYIGQQIFLKKDILGSTTIVSAGCRLWRLLNQEKKRQRNITGF